MICLDTNVLIYSVDPGAGGKRAQALELIRRAAGSAVLTEQALFEFVHVSTRKLGMPRDQAAATARGFAEHFRIALPGEDVLEKAMHLMSQYKIGVWDARLLAVCAAANADTLLSEDMQDGGKYGTVLVINPFEAANAAIVDRLVPP